MREEKLTSAFEEEFKYKDTESRWTSEGNLDIREEYDEEEKVDGKLEVIKE